ncbi:MAG: tetratricopeptide repeat protein [Verrucomicrobiae bacterium]|nr:tetratricopeptide repeat protein [Verrucomicrobiae bacterium]
MSRVPKTSPFVVGFAALIAAFLGAATTVALLNRSRNEDLSAIARTEHQRATNAIAAAQRNTNQANRAREQAEELVDFILDDLRTGLLPIGRTELLSAASERAAAYFENLPPDQITPESELNRAKVLVTIGQALTDQGDYDDAAKRFEAGVDILERLTDGDPAQEAWQFELGWSLTELGILLDKQRAYGQAQEVNERALAIFLPKVQGAKSQDVDWIYGVAAAQFGLASAAAGERNVKVALDRYAECAATARTGLMIEPDHILTMQVLAISLNDAGLTRQRNDDHEAAIPLLQQGTEAMRKLMARDPRTRRWEKELATGLNNIGISLDALERYDEAQTYLREALTLRQGLAVWDSRNGAWLANLANSWHNLAMLSIDQKNDAKAQQEAIDSLNVFHQLTMLEPANERWRADMKESHETLGRTMQRQGRPEAARALYRALITRAQELLKENVSLRPWEDRIMTLHRLLADAELACGSSAKEVLAVWSAAAAVRARSFADHPQSFGARRRLGEAIARLGDAAREASDHRLELQCFALAHYLIASADESGGPSRSTGQIAREHAFAMGLQATARVFVGAGETWRFYDGEQAPGNWAATDFDDSQWKSGPAPLGYGDGDEATTVSFGYNPDAKPITAWFRKSIETEAPPDPNIALHLGLVCDDGAVVYLNGKEIVRYGMPAGDITAKTPASATAREPSEHDFNAIALNPAELPWLPGRNIIAVEVHQNEAISSDLRFDFELISGFPSPQPLTGFELKSSIANSLLSPLIPDFLQEELRLATGQPQL